MPELDEQHLLHRWLRFAARSRPDAPAVVEEERVISFGQLWEHAATLAGFLTNRGLGRGDRVALLLPKTIEGITSMFACLSAGAIYVPIQPQWPLSRIETTLRECEPHFLIAEPGHPLAGQGPAQPHSAPVIQDHMAGTRFSWEDALAHFVKQDPEPVVEPGDPAFILFTSGSTGRPKGVTISHRAVASFVEWAAEEFRIGPEDRIACPSPLSFDLSTFDVFSMALRGAACHIVPESVVWMPRFLAQFLRDHGINVWYSVPSILAGLLEEARFTQSHGVELRLVAFAGEAFSSQNVLRLQAAVPGAACYNLYGPTETNVVTYHRVPEEFDPSRPLPIGRACPYAELRLDPRTSGPRGAEQVGELLIAGESVMNGYWNRPEETERAFRELPAAEGAKKRYYRSGDQVVCHRNGEYTHIGRLDRQVKRRGFRIELGEIEAALRQHADVAESAVISSGEADAGTTITAFIRPRPSTALSEPELRRHCARHLPLYMVPDEMIVVDAIPKGDRGKTDYAALKALCSRRR